MLKLKELTVDTYVRGLVPGSGVKVVHTRAAGDDAMDVIFERLDGRGLPRAISCDFSAAAWSSHARP